MNNNPRCWGRNFFGESLSAPAVQFSAITAGAVHSCGIATADGSIRCWGYNASMELVSPAGSFSAISAGSRHTCAIESAATRRVRCWGLQADGRTANQDAAFDAIDAGAAQTCGIRSDKTVTCWGFNAANPPSTNQYSRISTGFAHVCGILANGAIGSLSCWPSGISDGRTTVPSGMTLPVLQVSAGGSHTCAIDSTNTMFCFGSNTHGETSVPAGTYLAVQVQDEGGGFEGVFLHTHTHSYTCTYTYTHIHT